MEPTEPAKKLNSDWLGVFGLELALAFALLSVLGLLHAIS
jgi:hypothetical protein